jgi:hypothetical protein
MVAMQIEQTPQHWTAVLRELQSGHPVCLLRKRTVVATMWLRRKPRNLKRSTIKAARSEQRRIGMAGRRLAAKTLAREDFSAWKP